MNSKRVIGLIFIVLMFFGNVAFAGGENQNIKTDRFDSNLVSSDNMLKLNITDETDIILEDGTAFEGELANRKLVVTYEASTRSIPAKTTPTEIVVLFEKASVPVYKLAEDEKEALEIEFSEIEIIVNEKRIQAPDAYENDQGTIMVPLRAISEAIGYEVNWNQKLNSVTVGKGISVKIGEDNYICMKMAPIQLGTAPELKDGKTYVPLNFFRKVVNMNNAYIFESQIVIDNAKIMK
ncbi:hypothetical protein GGQ84_000325 [Desulfitispora alkaliphila]|uniref:copper amine oxidase N-terminal domain-containing protein n=1 Tax=Desulfitispora alkaliphila TaxID=622674 RepID=UPI003D213E06